LVDETIDATPAVRALLADSIKEYVESAIDEQEWPYAGKIILDAYIDHCITNPPSRWRAAPGMSKIKAVYNIIFDWKEKTDDLADTLEADREDYRMSHKLPYP